MLKQLMRLKLFAVALFLAASCAVDGEPMDGDQDPGRIREPPTEGVLLTDWVDSMVANDDTPDTVKDKLEFVIDVPDQEGFAKYFPR